MTILKKIALTGAAGQIAHSLIYRIASGDLYKDEDIILNLMELPKSFEKLQGITMELQDCAFPRLKAVNCFDSPEKAFEDVDIAILIGSKPRGPGMERADLLVENGKIFVDQGRALNKVANKNTKVLVVGNPCNTNCLIAMHNASKIPQENFHALMRLDENRAKFQIAAKIGVTTQQVTNLIVWGNHSPTQVPDFFNAQASSDNVLKFFKDRTWLEKDFFEIVQNRGASVIKARGKSSAASAANAIIGQAKSLTYPNSIFSSGIISDKNPYNIEENLIFSFPCRINTNGKAEIFSGFKLDPFIHEKILVSEKELIKERDAVRHFLKG